MAQTAAPRPQLVAPRAADRRAQTLEAVRTMAGGFDIDAWHVMEERDNALIADEILNGPGSSKFVYNFEIKGTPVTGVSVVGARHLANHYKGLKHRLVASTRKVGEVFTFTSYPAEHIEMRVTCSVVPELGDEDDFYSAICEVTDIKTGNTLQVERQELRYEERRGGGWFERPHYATIAQSKAYRNAVLALVPQDVVIRWKQQMLRLQRNEEITASVIDEKRSSVIRFAAQKAIALDRHAVEALTLDQIAGLGDAAREGRLPAFVEAAKALGLEVGQGEAAETAEKPQSLPQAKAGERQSEPAPQQTSAQQTSAQQPNPGGHPDRPREQNPPLDTQSTAPEGAPNSNRGPSGSRGRRVNFEA